MNVFFELCVASAPNNPTLLFLTSEFPKELIPPSGIPYLRMDMQERRGRDLSQLDAALAIDAGSSASARGEASRPGRSARSRINF